MSGTDELREVCLWLARRAASDRGLIGRLVRVHHSFERVLTTPRAVLAREFHNTASDDGQSPGPGGAFWAADDGPHGDDEGLVAWCDADYPAGLRDLYDPPPALCVRGRRWREMLAGLNERATVAVVGARRPSPYGLEMSAALGGGLVRAGVNVVSGVALGIDAAAHIEALRWLPEPPPPVAAADGRVVASPVVCAGVLGAGVRLESPRTNERLFADLHQHGVLLSDFGWDLPPHAWRFPARNRIIAALADAVVIVEGRATSGALHTAQFANDIARDVLAVPGEAGRPLSAGPHKLLRDGAYLCESPEDILALLPEGSWRHPVAHALQTPAGDQAASLGTTPGAATGAGAVPSSQARLDDDAWGGVLAALRRGQHTADQLAARLDAPIAAVVTALSALEVEGMIERQPGGRYRARRDGRSDG